MEVRSGRNGEEWRAGRDEFARVVGEEWAVRGIRKEKEREGKGGWKKKEGKEEEGEDDEEGQRKYKAHPKDRHWDEVGKRVKLVVDNQATANVLNRKAICRSEFFRPIIRRCLNWQYGFVQAGWKPFKDSGDFIEWRLRKFNKIADHVANLTMDNRKSFSWRNTDLLEAIRPGNCNILHLQ